MTKEHSSKDVESIEQVETIEAEEVEVETAQGEPTEEVRVDDAAEKKAAEYLDRLQRTMAEFDNYRKRTDKEKSGMYDMGVCDTITNILPVLDNFERALVAPCEDESYVKGMQMIYKQMIDLLSGIGVTQIEAVGRDFDTNIHNAVMHIEDDAYGENEIVEEFQKGYIYKEEKVIRYSMVKVAN